MTVVRLPIYRYAEPVATECAAAAGDDTLTITMSAAGIWVTLDGVTTLNNDDAFAEAMKRLGGTRP